jgi:hypothetical protein
MKFRIALSLVALFFGGTVFLITRSFTLPLVNYVVYHAYLQKAPAEFSSAEIGQVFQQAFQTAQASRTLRQNYLQELFRLSQKLEKVQHLSKEEAKTLLDSIRYPEKIRSFTVPEGREEK